MPEVIPRADWFPFVFERVSLDRITDVKADRLYRVVVETHVAQNGVEEDYVLAEGDNTEEAQANARYWAQQRYEKQSGSTVSFVESREW